MDGSHTFVIHKKTDMIGLPLLYSFIYSNFLLANCQWYEILMNITQYIVEDIVSDFIFYTIVFDYDKIKSKISKQIITCLREKIAGMKCMNEKFSFGRSQFEWIYGSAILSIAEIEQCK